MIDLGKMREAACSCYEWCAVHDHGVDICSLENLWEVRVYCGIVAWLWSPLIVRRGFGDPEEDAVVGHGCEL